MKDVCSACHTQDWVDGHYAQYDAAVNLYNDKFGSPAKKIMGALKAAELLTVTPFDEELEWTFFYLWHHEGRRARMGASMMAPDYTQWHGFFEVAERFYIHFIPQAREVAHGNAEVLAVIDEVMNMDEHKWQKGLDPEEAAKVREFYKKRYGGAPGENE
jgi:hydroxylamine dehydrogenase